MAGKKILIVGASGLVGTASVKLFSGAPDWEVVAVSRRVPFVPLGKARHIPVDLLNEAQCREVFGAMSDVTHIAYCAVNEQEGNMVASWQDPVQAGKNMAMLRNVFDPLIAVAKDFRHISLVHGMKAYGSHIWDRVMPIPFVESLPRVPHENFYYHQEDYLRAKQAGQSWGWTIIRPAMIAGDAIGSNMNSYLVLGVFAALRKEAGLPLPQPTGASMVTDVTDADLIADGLKWAAESPNARDESFNLTNGDVFSLHNAFPIVADALKMELGKPQEFQIIAELEKLLPLWPGMVRKHGLRAPEDLKALFGESLEVGGSWTAPIAPADVVRYGIASTIKIKQAGFHGCIDTAEMIRKYMRRYQELGIIPPVA
ncbi:MAG TPA: NAD-dependent epimerase/dehydratase family protein [Alphaproteobacteria bacterium]|nr:NAD-dependent epimerase/dehydratase family protein [Alphaproteobacteria bacterium]